MRIVASVALVALAGAGAAASPRTYVLDPARSSVIVHVGKTGMFSFAGHEHEITAGRLEGEVVADADQPAAASVTVTFGAAGLKVEGAREPSGDGPKIQEVMEGPKVLEIGRYPEIRFTSKEVSAKGKTGVYDVELKGELSLHGVSGLLTVPVRVELTGDELTARGQVAFKQSLFGIHPVTAGGGTVKVRDEVVVRFDVKGRAK